MNSCRVALIQLNSRDNKKENLSKISKWTAKAMRDHPDIIVLPEQASYCSDTDEVANAEPLDGLTISTFQTLAQKYQVYFHCGSFLEKIEGEDRCYNTSVLLSPTGEILAQYRKIHLFDMCIPGKVEAMESKQIKPGTKVVTVDLPIGHFGFSICYDIRFPELYRALMEQGSKAVFVPAAFALHTGKDHWEALLKARAIENQMYVIAPAQIGPYPSHEKMTYGRSMVIDPWGTVIAVASDDEGYIIADLQWDRVEKIRLDSPCLKHRVKFLRNT